MLILIDDFGYECVTANGGESYQTPVMDKLAATGVRFEQCHVQPLCTPTRVQLMTGMSNRRNYTHFGHLDPSQKTFGNLLKQAGYATCITGKWQLSNGFEGPAHFGFDEYCLWQLTRRPGRYKNPGLEINGKTLDYTQERVRAGHRQRLRARFHRAEEGRAVLPLLPDDAHARAV